MNLNDTPSRGPYIPHGCDQQGRYRQAAEACTDIEADIERNTESLWSYAADLWLCSPGLRVGVVLAGSIIAAVGMLHLVMR